MNSQDFNRHVLNHDCLRNALTTNHSWHWFGGFRKCWMFLGHVRNGKLLFTIIHEKSVFWLKEAESLLWDAFACHNCLKVSQFAETVYYEMPRNMNHRSSGDSGDVLTLKCLVSNSNFSGRRIPLSRNFQEQSLRRLRIDSRDEQINWKGCDRRQANWINSGVNNRKNNSAENNDCQSSFRCTRISGDS